MVSPWQQLSAHRKERKMKKLMAILAIGALALTVTTGTTHADSVTRPFQTAASGTDSLGYGCNGWCVLASFNGSATSSHLGTSAWIANVAVDLTNASPTAGGQICAPAAGTATLPAASGDAVLFSYSGTVCVADPSNLLASPHTFTGTYQITGGTGRFENATGMGNITAGDDGSGNAFMSDMGSIGY
jgi:hypothetical protein